MQEHIQDAHTHCKNIQDKMVCTNEELQASWFFWHVQNCTKECALTMTSSELGDATENVQATLYYL